MEAEHKRYDVLFQAAGTGLIFEKAPEAFNWT
jgi:hypothetical protein